MAQESQSSNDNNPDSQKLIFDELDVIYQNQPDTFLDGQFQAERVVSLEARKLYKLADELTTARNYKIETQFLKNKLRSERDGFVGGVAKVLFNRALPISRIEPITEAKLRSQESQIGASIFGDFKPNEVRREFFYDKRIADRDSWFFHQVVVDEKSEQIEVTLHYEVHPNGILRVSSDPNTKNEFISKKELNDFITSTNIYHELVMSQMYCDNDQSSKKVA